jgi:UDP:flavonoid glycosyltransferase YjiC (YdhE family)
VIRPRRVLISTFGSAGDLLPLIPLAHQLATSDHEVVFAVPRSLGLYLRTLGQRAFAFGQGNEMRIFQDARIVSTRFGGWASWRSTTRDYVAPTLAHDTDTIARIVADWTPHLVVVSGFAAAARVAAARTGTPRVELSIYPQHGRFLPGAKAFGHDLRLEVAKVVGLRVEDPQVSELSWGVRAPTLLLHDRAFLRTEAGPAAEVAGFPYWDRLPSRPSDLERAEAWLRGSTEPIVLITLGSFLGARQHEAWAAALQATKTLGLRALAVGPQRAWIAGLAEAHPNATAVGFVPLSRLVGRVAAVVHHGGIGTTFAALRSGCPAVVVPQAFDQPFNARLLEASGAGLDGSHRTLSSAIERVVTDHVFAARAEAIAADLVPAGAAAARAAEWVIREAT